MLFKDKARYINKSPHFFLKKSQMLLSIVNYIYDSKYCAVILQRMQTFSDPPISENKPFGIIPSWFP